MIVALDPGHGGQDPGAVGPHGLREKDVVLIVAQDAAERFAGRGMPVLMIRDDDRFVALSERARIANAHNANCFVSIHCNAFTTPDAHGTETFAFSPTSQGAGLARAVHAPLVAALGRRDRGVKFASFAVLRETRMMAALLELAFISNPCEEALLADRDFLGRAAAAIVEGVAALFQSGGDGA